MDCPITYLKNMFFCFLATRWWINFILIVIAQIMMASTIEVPKMGVSTVNGGKTPPISHPKC